jgi:exosortase/archaeosortase family protein
MRQKRVFQLALASLAVLLMILPFMVSINEILTKLVEKVGFYMWIQDKIVPWEVRLIVVLLRPLGVEMQAYRDGLLINNTYAKISWNCIGWQSMFLFCLSLPVGFKGGEYTWLSKLEAVLIGGLGTFLINLLRVAATLLLLLVSKPLFALVFHDYLAAIVTIIWLIFFWWFSYRYVLEEKDKL